jgi:hypothetical protein
MKIKPTAVLVGLFVVGSIFLLAREVQAHGPSTTDSSHHSAGISLGTGVLDSSRLRTQRLEYRYRNRWQVAYERFGGDDWNTASYIGVSRLMYLRGNGRGPFLSLGAGYFDEILVDEREGEALVSERLTYELGIGYSWVLSQSSDIEAGWKHNSTAGRSKRNHGIDRVALSYNWRF